MCYPVNRVSCKTLYYFTPLKCYIVNSFRDRFIQKPEEQYGTWEKATSRFGNATFGKVATDLCISASQFSKLIYGTATEGMYTRSIRNIERLILEQKITVPRDEALYQSKQAVQLLNKGRKKHRCSLLDKGAVPALSLWYGSLYLAQVSRVHPHQFFLLADIIAHERIGAFIS